MQVELKPSDTRTVVTFENLATHNPMKSKKAGRPIFDEQEVCRVRFPGNKATAGCFPAHEIFRQGTDEFGYAADITYAQEFNDQYMKFKNGEIQTQAGTPLAELPFLTQGKRLELKALNIHTAEALAGLDGHALKILGPGGREWKNQAIAFLEVAGSTANQTQLNEALEAQNKIIDDLRAKIEQMGSNAPARREAEDELSEVESQSAFKDWETADILVWIREASPSTQIFPSWKRAKVLSVADELEKSMKK